MIQTPLLLNVDSAKVQSTTRKTIIPNTRISSAEKGQSNAPENPEKKGLSNGVYFKIMGYLLTAGWVGFILAASGGDTNHPLFDYIFVVPLAGWIIGMIVARIIAKKSGADRP